MTADDVSQECTLETYVILLSPNKFNKKASTVKLD